MAGGRTRGVPTAEPRGSRKAPGHHATTGMWRGLGDGESPAPGGGTASEVGEGWSGAVLAAPPTGDPWWLAGLPGALSLFPGSGGARGPSALRTAPLGLRPRPLWPPQPGAQAPALLEA